MGDWSGIIICGKSTVNSADGTSQYESGVLGANVATYGGGTNPVLNDNSGELTYARIEFAGNAIQTDKEINGLTLCAVGSETKIHHIQVSYGGDDAFEFFGGTVNATHLIAYRSTDDDFDFDQGYSGKIQYGISIKDPIISDGAELHAVLNWKIRLLWQIICIRNPYCQISLLLVLEPKEMKNTVPRYTLD
ncbi:hypothetical protein KUH03_06980 [Sphingobacterium sp. E70]|uniref:hypothetical protein n=1 Tax=Sphingobacterium sp. E70 TaxID=2853439 RepID=UPI00211C1E80|nr:hypothetical protein [Sphingobacterium sp. E70]ULT26590.1 hypothetical protein KUH03_06980 [Sphingobacterium sp. E70]